MAALPSIGDRGKRHGWGKGNRAPLAARATRTEAVREAVGGEPAPGQAYAGVLRNEWRIVAEP